MPKQIGKTLASQEAIQFYIAVTASLTTLFLVEIIRALKKPGPEIIKRWRQNS